MGCHCRFTRSTKYFYAVLVLQFHGHGQRTNEYNDDPKIHRALCICPKIFGVSDALSSRPTMFYWFRNNDGGQILFCCCCFGGFDDLVSFGDKKKKKSADSTFFFFFWRRCSLCSLRCRLRLVSIYASVVLDESTDREKHCGKKKKMKLLQTKQAATNASYKHT